MVKNDWEPFDTLILVYFGFKINRNNISIKEGYSDHDILPMGQSNLLICFKLILLNLFDWVIC